MLKGWQKIPSTGLQHIQANSVCSSSARVLSPHSQGGHCCQTIRSPPHRAIQQGTVNMNTEKLPEENCQYTARAGFAVEMVGATRSFAVVASMTHRFAHSCMNLHSGLMCQRVYLWFFVRYESNSVMQHGIILLAAVGHNATQRRQNILGKAYGVVDPLLPASPASILQPQQLKQHREWQHANCGCSSSRSSEWLQQLTACLALPVSRTQQYTAQQGRPLHVSTIQACIVLPSPVDAVTCNGCRSQSQCLLRRHTPRVQC